MREWMKAGSVLALFAGVAATPSFAGSLAGDCLSGPDCRPGVVVTPSQAHFDDVLVSIKQPMGHLRSVDYRRSPHVSVTRIHGQGEVPHESDFPSSFSGGCHPESLTYCKAGGVAPAPAPVAAPIPAPVAQPFVAPPVFAAPVHARPVVAAPAPAPVPTLRQWTASYDDNPARFTPRQYGSLDFVPGIAHVPSSWVDRDPGRAQAALNASGGGVAPGPQSGLQRIPDDTPGPLMPIGQLQGPAPVQPGSIVQPGPASHGPTREVFVGQQVVSQQVSAPVQFAAPLQTPAVQAPVMAQPIFNAPAFNAPVPGRAGPPLEVAPGVYGSSVGADGTYWEKVSGPTMMGDTVATQVICKRALPTQTVNPVVGVPVPVPYPVDECGPNHVSGHQPQFHAPVQGPVQHAPVQHAPVHHAPAYQTHGLAGGVWTQ